MEEMPLEQTPFAPAPKKGVNRRFIYLVIAIIILIIGFFFFRSMTSPKEEVNIQEDPFISTPTAVETPTETPTPTKEVSPTTTKTPTPKPTKASDLDRSELSVAVQNGSGEVGAAGSASDLLKKLGYDVISTSNADNFDYTDVTIRVKSASSDYLDLLEEDLKDDYTVASAKADLPNSFSSDALVIIGK